MTIRTLVFAFAMIVSVNLFAQTKQNSVDGFCKSIDINGKVVEKERVDLIKKICADDLNMNSIVCRWFDINKQDGTVSISEDKLESVIDFCSRYYSLANDTKKIKNEEETPWYVALFSYDWSHSHNMR